MTRRILASALAAAALLAWLAPGAATADPSGPTAGPATSAPTATSTPTAGASASATAEPTPEPTALADLTLPSTPSETPTRDDWKPAREVSLDSPLPPKCRAHLVREWLRIRCTKLPPGAGSVISGPSEDVFFYASVPRIPQIPDMHDVTQGYIEVVLPLRRGVSRLVQLTHMGGGGYDWLAHDGLLLLSQQWPPRQTRPTVLTDTRRWDDSDVLGMRIGGVEEADELGLPTRREGERVLTVTPDSPADRGGAQPGDVVTSFSSDWHRSLAFWDGPSYDLLVLRKATEKLIHLPRRPSTRVVIHPKAADEAKAQGAPAPSAR